MREYPRMVSKSEDDHRKVNDKNEEIKASLEGYESDWNPEVNEKRKGTDREILRGNSKKSEPIPPHTPPKVEELSPQQRAAITRKKNKEAKLNG